MAERRTGAEAPLPGFGPADEPALPPARRPLAARMRPRALAEVVGHAALLGPDALLPRLLAAPILQRLQHGRLIRVQLCRSRSRAHPRLAAALSLRWRQPQQ